MKDRDMDDELDWLMDEDDQEDNIALWAEVLADSFFLSDNEFMPEDVEEYDLGFLEPEAWEPLVEQLDGLVDIDAILDICEGLQPLLRLPGLPTQLLEAPLYWLEGALMGNLPPEPSGRRTGSRRLVQIALRVVRLAQELPDTARAAIHAWAEVHRRMECNPLFDDEDEGEVDMPPAFNGFSMMIAMTLIRWPERGDGEPLPPGFDQPDVFDQIMDEWQALPDGLAEEMDEAGDAEALFAQGQLAHLLSRLDGTHEGALLGQDPEAARAYSRLSRAILWLHNQCRHCPQRDGVACLAASGGPTSPLPLLDVTGEIARSGRVEGCIKT